MTGGDPPAKKADNEELIAGIERACELHSMPVTTSTAIAELDTIDLKRQTVRNRLKELASEEIIGAHKAKGWVFWAADEHLTAGNVDSEALTGEVINWDRFDPERIPEEILRDAISYLDIEKAEQIIEEHPDYDEPSKWDPHIRFTQGFTGISSMAVLLGLGLFSIDTTQYSHYIPEPVYTLGAVGLVGGVFFTGLGLPGTYLRRVQSDSRIAQLRQQSRHGMRWRNRK